MGLAQLLFLLKEAGCQVALVDGSFVTRERWPQDFDVCYEPQGMVFDQLPPVLRDVTQGRVAQKRRFGGEAMPSDFPFEANGRTVREAFARTREGVAKGLVRLELTVTCHQIVQFLQKQQVPGDTNESTDANPGKASA